MYARTTKLNDGEVLVTTEQMVAYREHMIRERRAMFFNGTIGQRCLDCGQGETDSINILLTLDSLSQKPIKLFINSPGGDLDTTFLFYDTMKLIQSPVITIGRYCASAAALILAAGTKRYLYPHAKVMLHLAAGQIGGDVRDIAIQQKQMQRYMDKVVDILCCSGVNRTRKQILKDLDRDFWLEPQEAIEYGLADEILTPEIWSNWCKEDF